jgi:hypothetical protein
MRLKYEGQVGPAHTEDRAYYFFAPVGVGDDQSEDVEAFWVIHIDSKSGKVLANSVTHFRARGIGNSCGSFSGGPG